MSISNLRQHAGEDLQAEALLVPEAYGYRDEEYLKLKIVATFLHPLPRSAEKNPL